MTAVLWRGCYGDARGGRRDPPATLSRLPAYRNDGIHALLRGNGRRRIEAKGEKTGEKGAKRRQRTREARKDRDNKKEAVLSGYEGLDLTALAGRGERHVEDSGSPVCLSALLGL